MRTKSAKVDRERKDEGSQHAGSAKNQILLKVLRQQGKTLAEVNVLLIDAQKIETF